MQDDDDGDEDDVDDDDEVDCKFLGNGTCLQKMFTVL